jgi:ABC-type Fe3+-citrate transport system substrate-binding protein
MIKIKHRISYYGVYKLYDTISMFKKRNASFEKTINEQIEKVADLENELKSGFAEHKIKLREQEKKIEQLKEE